MKTFVRVGIYVLQFNLVPSNNSLTHSHTRVSNEPARKHCHVAHKIDLFYFKVNVSGILAKIKMNKFLFWEFGILLRNGSSSNTTYQHNWASTKWQQQHDEMPMVEPKTICELFASLWRTSYNSNTTNSTKFPKLSWETNGCGCHRLPPFVTYSVQRTHTDTIWTVN